MGIREALVTYLKGHGGLASLVEDRIHPLVLPENPGLPAIVYQRISAPRTPSHDSSPGGAGLTRPRFQFTCWASDQDGAEAVGDQLIAALDGLKQTLSGVRVDAALVQNDFDDRDPLTDRFRRIVDVHVWHED